MATHRIAVLAGDGIGQEVTAEAVKVLKTVAKQAGVSLEFEDALVGGAAIDATGNPLPPATLELCKKAKAIMFGSVGGPKWDDPKAAVRPERETCSSPGSSATIAASSAVLTRLPLWPRASEPCTVARKVGWAFSQTEEPVVE